MIDCHCHLEQKDYEKDRNEVIEKCIQNLKAVVTCCAHPDDFDLTMKITRKYKNFVFATVGIHPEYIKEISRDGVKEFLKLIKHNKDNIIGIGEVGLDYYWIKEKILREKQKKLFVEFINLAKSLKKPLVIHARDAFEDTINILEQENARQVLMHMFGANHLVKRVEDNGWYISLNTIVMRSKKHKKIARDVSLEKILLETDAPWLDPKGGRNEPTNIKIVAERVAEIKKISFDKVWTQCTENAIRFYRLPL